MSERGGGEERMVGKKGTGRIKKWDEKRDDEGRGGKKAKCWI